MLEAANTGVVQQVGDPLAISIVVSWIMEKMKDSKIFPWIDRTTSLANTIVAAMFAALSAAGIEAHWAYQSGSGGTLTLEGITVGSVLLFLWTATKSFAFQYAVYRGIWKKQA